MFDDPVFLITGVLVGMVLAGAPIGWGLHTWYTNRRYASAERKVQDMLDEGRQKADEMAKEARKDAQKELDRKRDQLEKEIDRRLKDIEQSENKIGRRESALDKKFDQLDRREQRISQKESRLDQLQKQAQSKQDELDQKLEEAVRRCETISGMTVDEAKQVLLESLEKEVAQEAAAAIRRMESEARESAAKKARQIITMAIQKYAAEQVGESTVSVVPLSSDEIKGRIIGREGRNIRALEAVTGCNFVVDDTPEAVVLSCFDPLRREVARQSLERLLSDGRIHPGRIEDVVQKTEKDVQEAIRELGEQTAYDLGIHGLHPELIRLVGRLKYRTSYGQNILNHSIEVANIAKIMAGELGVDQQLAKRAGLLHDIGKAVSYEMEGTHANIGADLAKRYGESPAVVHAIAAHHAEEEPRTLVAVLVQSADAVSAARPGARRETLETYIKRLQQLESIADSFDGVAKAYAIQAGREIRILVDPEKVNDDEAALLARKITKKVESELEYPGQIRVTVLREVRSVEYAK
ncbi:MAG: ribonuclease Y [Candidatus Sumerlaeia bacterium]